MKKYFMMAAAAAMFMTSCSSDAPEVPAQATDGEEYANIEFTFAVESGMSRAGRELWSQAAKEWVTDVEIHVFNEAGTAPIQVGGVDLVWTVDAWASDGIKGDKQTLYSIPKEQRLPTGTYKYIAVGRDAAKNLSTLKFPAGTSYDDSYVQLLDANSYAVNELFADCGTITIPASGTIRKTIELKRKVAGILTYFENIPYKVGENVVSYVDVKIGCRGRQYSLVDDLTKDSPLTTYNETIHRFDLTTATYDEGTNIYTCAAVLPSAGVTPTKKANSWLWGSFLCPVQMPNVAAITTTITINLVKADGTTVVKTIRVKDENGNYKFDILRNNLYTLGQKLDDNSDPTTPVNPEDPDPDQPIDLSSAQELVIKVIANWEAIHILVPDLE